MKVQEIERRFLLKNLPAMPPDGSRRIEQFYTPDGHRFRRGRKEYSFDWTYEKIIKRPIQNLINEEEIFDCSALDYLEEFKNNVGNLQKSRYIYHTQQNTFEVDEFDNMRLIICEVELQSPDQEILFPKEIKDQIILEITGMPEFSNFNLAKNIK